MRGLRRFRGRRKPTIVDVAARAGVSAMTVSRVMNSPAAVRKETRDAVLAAIRELRFQPNRSAQALATVARIRIGFLYSNPSAGYLSEFMFGSLDQASRMNVQLAVQRCLPDDDGMAALHRLVECGIDGLILPPPLCDSDAVIAHVAHVDLPAVAVATARPADSLSVVCIDDYRAALEMTSYLLSLGHRDIGFIVGEGNLTASERRLAGYRDGLEAAGIGFRPELVARGSFTYRSGLDAAEMLLDGVPSPTAIFASNDDMAAAAIAVAHVRGLVVPRDLTVCGYDDTTLATTVWPPLTTIRQPVADMARSALDLLVTEIRKRRQGVRAIPQHIVQGFRLIERQSSGAPPPISSDPRPFSASLGTGGPRRGGFSSSPHPSARVRCDAKTGEKE